ncbi:hypothetical protein H4R19_000759 [Coemansia spiralis]|nr:hypothetical protein H4R19_000759 [Coemansia spiralis]
MPLVEKIRRRRQKSLFSMSTADEYSLLDSGRIGLAHGPSGHARHLRPRDSAGDPLADRCRGDVREPPTLDLITEMLKEEIRQATSLKLALDRVSAETESMSQRVSTLSMADTMSSTALLTSPDSSAARRLRQQRNGGKQVQFSVPDEVRFRWLGMFSQPAPDDTASDGCASDGESHSGPAPAPGMQTHSRPLDTAVRRHTDLNDNGPADRSAAHAPPADAAMRLSAPTLDAWLSADAAHAPSLSEDLAAISTNFRPLASNSSVEAVYGGTPYETHRPPPPPHRATEESKRTHDPANARLAYLQGSGSAASLGDSAPDDGAVGSGAGDKYATVSGRAGRAQAPAGPRPGAGGPSRPKPRRPANGTSPFGLDRRDGAPSPFSKPSLATSKVTVSKSPVADQSPHRITASLLWPRLQGVRPDPLRDTAAAAPPLQRSKSVRAINMEPAMAAADAQPRRGNSFDESSISSRKGGLAAVRHAAADLFEAEVDDATVPVGDSGPVAGGGGGGLLRRVTVSSVHRRGHLPHAVHSEHGGGGGLLGGTRDFLKQRLRTRTHSNSPANGTPDARGAAADDRGGTRGKGAVPDHHRQQQQPQQQQRPRRRSDAEVKSRGSAVLPQTPPAVPDHPQLRNSSSGGAAAGASNGNGMAHGNNAVTMQHPYAPRPSADRQSEWVAVSPPPSSASVHNVSTTLRPDNLSAAAAAHRRSHDGGGWARPPPDYMGHLNTAGQSPSSSSSGSTESPPPPPALPALPPHSPLPLRDLHKARVQHAPGENDSIDYHMRRLRDRKSRRSSFMTTIGHMLGRKE